MHAVDARLHELACCEWESVRGGINFIHRVRDHQLQRMYLGSDHHALWLLVLRTRSVWCALCLCFHLCLCLFFFSRKRRRAAPQYIKKKKGGKKSLQYTKLQIGGSVATLNKAS